MNEIIRLGTENPSETQNFFKGVAEAYKSPNNQQNTLTGFSKEIREKLNIKGPNYVPGYDFSQAIIEQALRKESIDRRPGGLKKTSEGFLEFIEKMGINPQDPSVPLKRLTEEYLLRPYITKVRQTRPTPIAEPAGVVASPTGPASVEPIEGEAGAGTQAAGAGAAAAAQPEAQPAEHPAEVAPKAETPAQKTSRIRRMFAGLNEFLSQPSDEAARLRAADQADSETLMRALGSLAIKVPEFFRRTPQEQAEQAAAEATAPETEEVRTGRVAQALRGINDFLAQPNEEAARLRAADREAFETLKTTSRSVYDLLTRGLRGKPGGTAGEPPTPPTETPVARSRVRRLFGGLQEFLAQPGDEAARLRQADREAFETLQQTVRSLAGKVPNLFARQPAEITEEPPTTVEQKTSRIRRMFAGLNEFLSQPSDEAARLRAADQADSETLMRALGSLAIKVPDLFRRTPQEVAAAAAAPTEAPK